MRSDSAPHAAVARPTAAIAPHRDLGGIGLIVGAAFGLATLGTISRAAYGAGLEPLNFAAWRGLVGGALLVAVGGAMSRRRLLASVLRAPRRDRVMLGLATVANLAVTLAILTAYARMSVALGLLIFYSYPVWVAVSSRILRYAPLTGAKVVGIGVALAGLLVVVGGQLEGGRLDPLGVTLALVASAAKTVYIQLGRRGYPAVDAAPAVGVICLGTGIGACAAALLASGAPHLLEPVLLPGAWLPILLGGTLSAAIPMALFIRGVRRLGATPTSVIMLLEPVIGTVLAAMLLGEPLGLAQLAGGALVLAGGLVVQLGTPLPAATALRREVSTLGGRASLVHPDA